MGSGDRTSAAVAPALTVTEPAAPAQDMSTRRCHQCQHLANSSYGYPLGLCSARNHRIQHFESEPTRFGCGYFETRRHGAEIAPYPTAATAG